MKKNLLRLLCGVMALAMVLSLYACGSENGSSDQSSSQLSSSSEESSSQVSDDSSSSESESSSDESTTSTSASTSGTYASIQEFLDDPTVKAQLDEMIGQLKEQDDSMSISVTGEGNKLVYLFTFSEAATEGADLETMGSALEEAMAGQEANFEGIANSVALVVDVPDPKVVVTYAAHDGTVIFTKEFSAK